jgi:hypothetical protein
VIRRFRIAFRRGLSLPGLAVDKNRTTDARLMKAGDREGCAAQAREPRKKYAD